ncbi:hypothetical protein L1987_32530 [Smallanthus sonchifolius]|uniref:Uncharacterized protein n=1 Tax=Smallanthus sonchifolius TaxID=185202 RepID=A0ACB9HMY8_9ASTR|nr:hypothetical protein L1987_32530 [Smallanthus sonchifolius]
MLTSEEPNSSPYEPNADENNLDTGLDDIESPIAGTDHAIPSGPVFDAEITNDEQCYHFRLSGLVEMERRPIWSLLSFLNEVGDLQR